MFHRFANKKNPTLSGSYRLLENSKHLNKTLKEGIDCHGRQSLKIMRETFPPSCQDKETVIYFWNESKVC